MNKLCCLIIMFITCGVCEAQNLVPNPSFEDTIHCPSFPTPNIQQAAFWWPYYETPDYFNPCANNQPFFGVPDNFAGHQDAFIGNAYAGLITWYVTAVAPMREYMGVQLTQPLSIGTKYFVSCYISNADSAGANSSSNNFGFRFSTVPYSFFGTQAPINNFSHIHSDSVITDKINWTRISGSFVADSTYQYLALGNFYFDPQTIIDSLPPFGQTCSYYYVDAVCVTTDSLYDVTWTSVAEINKSTDEVFFPNPFSDELNITVKRNERVEVNLYDMTARKILHQSFLNSTSIKTERLAKGIYLYEVKNKNGVIKKGKVVKD